MVDDPFHVVNCHDECVLGGNEWHFATEREERNCVGGTTLPGLGNIAFVRSTLVEHGSHTEARNAVIGPCASLGGSLMDDDCAAQGGERCLVEIEQTFDLCA